MVRIYAHELYIYIYIPEKYDYEEITEELAKIDKVEKRTRLDDNMGSAGMRELWKNLKTASLSLNLLSSGRVKI